MSIKSWDQNFCQHFWPKNSVWLASWEFHCGEVCTENGGDVTARRAPRPIPVTFHEDIFSSVVFLNTDKAGTEHFQTYYRRVGFFSLSLFFSTASAYAMSDFQLTSLPDEVTPQSEIWFCSERSCWWSVMKRNRAVWRRLLWSGSGKEPKHLLFTCLSTLNLSGPSEAELRAAVAIETKQDGQYCRGRGWRSGMNRLSLCSLVKDSKRSLNRTRKKQ